MISYASRTGTKRNLEALRAAGWRLMISARGVLRTEGFDYALDNGAWTAHQRGETFDDLAFDRAVSKLGVGADFIVIPDIVAGGRESLLFSLDWWERLRSLRVPLLLAVQDGMTVEEIRAVVITRRVGLFLGGSTGWKLSTMMQWGGLCAELGAHFHIGRVNTERRIHLAQGAGATSIDGSSASRFAKNTPRLDRAVRQKDLFRL